MHPNDPYPSRRQLRQEAAVETLLSAQEQAARRLRDVLTAAVAEIEQIEFPLGSPVQGYDVPDILSTLRDLIPPCDPLARHEAEEAAWDRVEGERT